MSSVEKTALADTVAIVALVTSVTGIFCILLSNSYYRAMLFTGAVLLTFVVCVTYLLASLYEWRVSVNSRKV